MLSAQQQLISDQQLQQLECQDITGMGSPSKNLMKPALNLPNPVCVINPHHPAVAARASSTSNNSVASATTPTSPRPSATDLVTVLQNNNKLVLF